MVQNQRKDWVYYLTLCLWMYPTWSTEGAWRSLLIKNKGTILKQIAGWRTGQIQHTYEHTRNK